MSPPEQLAQPERRSTRQRKAVVDLLTGRQDFLTAQEVYLGLHAKGDKVGLATVYRALATLVEDAQVDILRLTGGEARYRLCETLSHHHHLVCRQCGRTVELEGIAIEEWADDVAAAYGFSDVSHTFELLGSCSTCVRTPHDGVAREVP